MKEAKRRGEQYMTFDALMVRLGELRELREAAATSWTPRANVLYKKLFYVDVMKASDVARSIATFSAANAFTDIHWSVPCAYPQP